MLYLTAVRGPLILVFALAGLFISVFYVAPPIRLKHHGLGEPGVFLVWGPLMVGGTFLAATGTIPGWVLLVSVPYALLVTSVLFGKHIDKIEADTAIGVRTLPVILGEARARTVGSWLMIAFYPLTLLAVVVGLLGPWVLLVVLGIPRLLSVLKVFRQPKPLAPPPGYPERGWPLWFVGYAFVHTRRAGGLLTLGLLLNALLPVTLPWRLTSRRGAAGPVPWWARYSSRSSLVTTPTGRPARTATSADARPDSRAKASSSVADASTSGSGGSMTSPTVRSTTSGSR